MPIATKKPKPIAQDALIVTEQIAHRKAGSDARAFETRKMRALKTKEQPYERQMVATAEWMPLDLGWLAGKPLGMLAIRNDEGKPTQVLPTLDQRTEVAAKVLQVAYNAREDEGWLVDPGMSMRGVPSDPSALQVRSLSGEIEFTIWASPE